MRQYLEYSKYVTQVKHLFTLKDALFQIWIITFLQFYFVVCNIIFILNSQQVKCQLMGAIVLVEQLMGSTQKKMQNNSTYMSSAFFLISFSWSWYPSNIKLWPCFGARLQIWIRYATGAPWFTKHQIFYFLFCCGSSFLFPPNISGSSFTKKYNQKKENSLTKKISIT